MIGIKLDKSILPYLAIIGLIVYIIFFCRSEEAEIIIPSQENTLIIDNPVSEVRYDTIFKDSIHRKEVLKVVQIENPVNKGLLLKYQAAIKDNDSLKQLALFKEAITERKYSEVLEDSVQVIKVESFVVGTLKSQVISYKTKEQVFRVQAEILKPSVFVGGFMYDLSNEVVFGASANLLNKKKNKLFSIGYDTRKRVHLGFTIKLF